jgi:hypothetical protein
LTHSSLALGALLLAVGVGMLWSAFRKLGCEGLSDAQSACQVRLTPARDGTGNG